MGAEQEMHVKDSWDNSNDLLEEVLALDRGERAAFLDDCGASEEVVDEVRSLLDLEEEAENSLECSAVEFSKDFISKESNFTDENPLVGKTIGPYRIEREIGQGGMGAVYLAVRADGKFTQRVAVKLLKREMNSSALRRRFEHEREILSALEHPNIARLLDAGSTDDGIPYIALEYVEGLPINVHCDKQGLGLEERLDLFRTVCEAVDFAHRNLIVHRDLKPSNILISSDGIPKLLDFGISKFLSHDVGDITATVTKLGVMTPGYASPEQLTRRSVTTATDVYSLGVILFELLAGSRPFQEAESDLKRMLDAVLTTDPPLLSSTVARSRGMPDRNDRNVSGYLSGQDGAKGKPTAVLDHSTVENVEQFTQPALSSVDPRSLRGDLDNIVRKALEQEVSRRYASPQEFADDIHRFLRGQPVEARTSTVGYRISKFVKRNRIASMMGALLFVAIAFGIGATVWQAVEARSQAAQARAEADKTRKTLEFFERLIDYSTPYWFSANPERKREATLTEVTELAAKNIDKDLEGDPEVRAEVLYILGKNFFARGDFESAENLYRKAIKDLDSIYGAANQRSMQIRGNLGDQLWVQGKLRKAETEYRKAIEYLRPLSGEDETNDAFLAGAINGLGNIMNQRGNHKRAEELHQESLELANRFEGRFRFMTTVLLGNLANSKRNLGEYEAALALYEGSLKEIESRGSKFAIEAGNIHINLCILRREQGDLDKASFHLREAGRHYSETVGEKSIYWLRYQLQLARNHLESQEFSKALQTAEAGTTLVEEIASGNSLKRAHFMHAAGESLTGLAQYDKADRSLRMAIDLYQKQLDEPNPMIARARLSLSRNLKKQGKSAQAEVQFSRALEGLKARLGPEHPLTKKVSGEN